MLYMAGLRRLVFMIQKEIALKPVYLLCYTNASSGNVIFNCFEDASPLEPFLKQFMYLFDDYPSKLFTFIWRSAISAHKPKTMQCSPALTFDDIATNLWRSVFVKCCELIDSVRSMTIKLEDVDFYFRQFRGDCISDDLKSLFSAIEACHGRKLTACTWIRNAVYRMEQYWALCEQGKAAKTVLELKNRLHLTGDFHIIEDVASKVNVSVPNCTLDSIGQELVEARSFLEKLTTDRKKLECLEKFAACLNIIDWIRKETKGQGTYLVQEVGTSCYYVLYSDVGPLERTSIPLW